MSGDSELVVGCAAAIGFGVYLFYRGLSELRLRRLIEETGTSKIRSLAMGLVELCGRATPSIALTDPVYQKSCVYFRVEAKERRGSGKNSRWVTIYENNTDHIPFYLSDETGRVFVSPAGARIFFEKDIYLTITPGSLLSGPGDDPISRFVSRLPCGGSGNPVAISAHFIREYETVYVLGYAVSGEHPFTLQEKITDRIPAKVRLSLAEISRLLKADPERMRRLDKNGDNQVDAEEWDEGLRAFQKELEKTQKAAAPDAALATTPAAPAPAAIPEILIRTTPDGLLILADKEENELLTHLGRWSIAKIAAGPALALLGAYLLIQRFGL